MKERSPVKPLRRIVLILVLALAAWRMSCAVMYFVHSRQQDAIAAPLTKHGYYLARDKDGWGRGLSTLSRSNSATDEELGCIRELVHLTRLEITGRGFTDRALAHLTGLKELEDLDVSPEEAWPGHAILTDEGLSYLRGLESLRRLRYFGARVTDAGFRHFEGLHNLEDLSLEWCREATDDGLKSLAKLDHLERLTLFNGPGMTGERLAALPNPSTLRQLHFDNVSDGGMRTITRFTNLRDLFIGGRRLGVDGLNHLLALTNLDRLIIQKASLDNRALEKPIGQLTWLKELRIYDCPITGDALKHLRALKELEVLWVSGRGVDDTSTPYLQEFPNLRVLHFDGTSITAASLPRLLRSRTLEGLSVPFSIPMTPERRRELMDALPNLGWLHSADGHFDFEGEGRQSYSAQILGRARKVKE